MKTQVLLFALLSGLIAPSYAMAGTLEESGNDFVRICSVINRVDQVDHLSDQETVDGGECAGYVMGLMDGVYMQHMFSKAYGDKSDVAYCFPDSGIPISQQIRIVLKYINDNPERAHLRTGRLAIEAFHKTFPCSK